MKTFQDIVMIILLAAGAAIGLILVHQNQNVPTPNTTEALDQLLHIQAIEAVLKSDPRIRDPDSVQVIDWTGFDAAASSWQTYTTFRARNGFGGYRESHARINCVNGKAKIDYTR